MSFIRPEIQAALHRWRFALIGLGVLCLGAYFMATGGSILRFVGLALVAAGAGLATDGYRRARFPQEGGGLGVVQIDERQITYFSPNGGGAMSIEELVSIDAWVKEKGRAAHVTWVFTDVADQKLMVPSNAEGAEAIYDVLSVLKGADFRPNIDSNHSKGEHKVDIWRKKATQLH